MRRVPGQCGPEVPLAPMAHGHNESGRRQQTSLPSWKPNTLVAEEVEPQPSSLWYTAGYADVTGPSNLKYPLITHGKSGKMTAV
jgi:hypothetical protein